MNSVELFTGAGGLALGVAEAGFSHSMVVEWDDQAYGTLVANQSGGIGHLANWRIVHDDVRTVSFEGVPRDIDLVAGGPPCQPFSIGGKHRGPGDHRDMWAGAIRAVSELKPRAFLFENVKGLVRKAFADYLSYVLLHLEWPNMAPRKDEPWQEHLVRLRRHHASQGLGNQGLRYKVTSHQVNAADHGAPQKRERVILIGFRSDLDISWDFPSPTHSRERLLWDKWGTGDYWERHKVPRNMRGQPGPNDARLIERLQARGMSPHSLPWVTVRDAIVDLPRPTRSEKGGISCHVFQPGARVYVGHTGSPPDEPAKALKAGDHGVPGGENMIAHPNGKVRYFTVRESARLQGFPDEYRFPWAWTVAMRQLGNAVPVQLAKALATSIADALGSQDSRERQAA
ncbi:MAG: DNA cytosine methyltransferase [Proteobacteria bacterium]|nr:DNA cytosine methyltransferase [Pseudomonadota bacterium]MBU1451998.1 DNA cytosine methyltransferase [Pseudomonadota bacterium]MBU2467494.1 DNA cytosine methyltransferase [Pseudomonadota bacterium]MBU2517713.1 DNA cytosine methyltransferase [Pseudomonadota bacterium]